MHKMILGQRLAIAHNEVIELALKIAEEFPTAAVAADKLKNVHHRDPAVKQLEETEALAGFLRAIHMELELELADQPPPAPIAEKKPAATPKK